MDWLDFKEFILDSGKIIIIIIIAILLFLYVVSITQVVGSSMSPTLENQEILILNKIKYKLFDIKRGDIISLSYDDTKYLIKRVIGLPGDYIYISNNALYINGNKYEEEYLKEDTMENFKLEDIGYSVIPDNYYLVLGDNRNDSLDSREIGLINKKDIMGEIMIRFWPLNKIKFF